MDKLEFEARLNEVYGGTVRPLNCYINENATLCFYCSKCGLKFFNNPSRIVGKDHQQHACGYPYGDRNGERLAKVSSIHKNKKIKESFNIDHLYKMVWEDYSYQQIAKELQVNPSIIEDYFIIEGLL